MTGRGEREGGRGKAWRRCKLNDTYAGKRLMVQIGNSMRSRFGMASSRKRGTRK